MINLTIKKLAKIVGISVDRLLFRFQEAGLVIDNPNHIITEKQKKILLNHINKSKNNDITIKSKKNVKNPSLIEKYSNQIIIGRDTYNGKTVNIEVLKKKTYNVNQKTFSKEHNKNIDSLNDNIKQDLEKTLNIEKQYILNKENYVTSIDRLSISYNEKENIKVTSDNIEKNDTVRKVPIISDKMEYNKTLKVKKKNIEKFEIESTTHLIKKVKKKIKYNTVLKNMYEDELLYTRKNKYKKNKSEKSNNCYVNTKNITQNFEKPKTNIIKKIFIPETISISDLSKKMSIKAIDVIKVIMGLNIIVTINQVIDQNTASKIVKIMGHEPILLKENDFEEVMENYGHDIKVRPPIVTIMGHVNHGKTSLLDYIRKTKKVEEEIGGITQHIGAYQIQFKNRGITFLDTPGHSAFSAMRARGVTLTDIVILVIASDDGVKPQTIEAIQHAKLSNVPIIVAISKIDKPGSNPDKIINILSRYEIIPDSWGGDNIFVQISIKSGTGIDELLNSILLQAELLELTAPIDGLAKGVVIESFIDKGKGPIATVLVQSGTLKKGDIILAGSQYGKVRALLNENNVYTEYACPSTPIEILGLSSIPNIGELFIVVSSEKKAREIALFRQGKYRDINLSKTKRSTIEDMTNKSMHNNEKKSLNIILKTDVQGSIEAILNILESLSNEEIQVKIIYSGVGDIVDSDVNLAIVSHAIIIGFNVRINNSTKKLAEQASIPLYNCNVIYDIIDKIKLNILNIISPKFKETILGTAKVCKVFNISRIGSIFGCIVINGVIKRNYPVRILRNSIVIHEGIIDSLKRFKEDILEIHKGLEFGIKIKNFNDLIQDDIIKSFNKVKIDNCNYIP